MDRLQDSSINAANKSNTDRWPTSQPISTSLNTHPQRTKIIPIPYVVPNQYGSLNQNIGTGQSSSRSRTSYPALTARDLSFSFAFVRTRSRDRHSTLNHSSRMSTDEDQQKQPKMDQKLREPQEELLELQEEEAQINTEFGALCFDPVTVANVPKTNIAYLLVNGGRIPHTYPELDTLRRRLDEGYFAALQFGLATCSISVPFMEWNSSEDDTTVNVFSLGDWEGSGTRISHDGRELILSVAHFAKFIGHPDGEETEKAHNDIILRLNSDAPDNKHCQASMHQEAANRAHMARRPMKLLLIHYAMDIAVWEYSQIAVIDDLFDVQNGLSLETDPNNPHKVYPIAFTAGYNAVRDYERELEKFRLFLKLQTIATKSGVELTELKEILKTMTLVKMEDIFKCGSRSITFGQLVEETIPADEKPAKKLHTVTHKISGWHGLPGAMIVVFQRTSTGIIQPRMVGIFMGGTKAKTCNVAVHITSEVKHELDKVFNPQSSANP
ncbi:hypothetical protein MMC13_000387 [Lambiella insularis]|nr:hypothetical protein [Lambiella insularis]